MAYVEGQTVHDADSHIQRKFYRDNFIDLMGNGLDPALHDPPQLAAT